MKKFFNLLILFVFCIFSTFSLSSCKNNDIEKFSKNLTNYNMDLNLIDEKKVIVGSELVDYVNKTESTIEYLPMHLYPRAFRKDATIKPYTSLTMATCFPNGESFGDIKIKTLLVNGKEKGINFIGDDEDILNVDFGFKLQPKQKVKIKIDFELKLPNSTHRFGYYNGNINLGNFYPIACEFLDGKFDMSPYYSTGDPFCSSVSNYHVNFSYSKDYQLCSTGDIVSSKIDEQKTDKIEAFAVRDFALCLSNKSTIISSNIGNTKINYMGYKNDVDLNENLKVINSALKYFNSTFGEYPYKTLSICKTPFIYGGMEYPNLVFISDSIQDDEEKMKVIVHEIAHQWWYGIVGNNEVKDSWLDESLSEYSTILFFKNNKEFKVDAKELINNAISSYSLYVDVIKTISGEVNTKMNLKVNEYKNDYEYSYMIYVKGVIMFDSLTDAIGEKKLISGFKKYFKNNKFKIATKKDFYSAIKSSSKTNLDNFFESYLNGTAIISKIN